MHKVELWRANDGSLHNTEAAAGAHELLLEQSSVLDPALHRLDALLEVAKENKFPRARALVSWLIEHKAVILMILGTKPGINQKK